MRRLCLVAAFVGLLSCAGLARAGEFSFGFSYGHQAPAPAYVVPPPVVVAPSPFVEEEPPVVVEPPPVVVAPAPVYVPPPVVVHPAPVYVPRYHYHCAPRDYHPAPCRPHVSAHFRYYGHPRRCR